MAEFRADQVAVTTPATSANLGPGYDTFGLALSLYDVVTGSVAAGGLEVEVRGEGAETLPLDESHLVVRSVRAAFDRLGVNQPGLRVSCRNAIPHGRGLGSSSSAIVAGVTLATGLVDGCDWAKSDVLQLAAEIEGHPDNVAACVHGGFTIAWTESEVSTATRLDVDRRIRPRAFVPPDVVATETARQLLPDTVSHADAAFNVARAALLVAALIDRPDLLHAATADRLHQAYRAPAMPQSADLVARLRGDQTAAFVSGAGPTVLALHVDSRPVPTRPPGWRVVELDVDRDGARFGVI